MSRSLLLFLALVLAPAAALSVLAFGAADRDYREGLQAHRLRLEEEADGLAGRIKAVLADASRRAEAEELVGYARDGEWIGYEPGTGPARASPAGEEELRRFGLSLRGGESYELLLRDPARAIDAYSFYLPRIRSKVLRSRLRFRMARAAFASGDERLATALARSLLEDGAGAIEEGVPVDLLAALALKDPEEIARRARAHQRELSTGLLARLSTLAAGDSLLPRAIERRRALERAVEAHPELLGSRNAVLDDGLLLLARPLEGGLRSLVLEPLELPPLVAGGFEARLEYSPAGAVSLEKAGEEAPSRAEAARAIRLPGGTERLATLYLRDPGFEAKLEALSGRRFFQRGLVALLILVTAGGTMALVRYVLRERHLGRLRARLLQNVSHELKTPVTSIRMFAEMLAEDPVDAGRTRRFGQLLRAESLRLSQLIENLLSFSTAGRERQPLALEPVDLPALLGGIAGSFTFRAREKGVDFQMEGATEPIEIATHPEAVERIVQNLLDNALKYRRQEAPAIRLRVEAAEDRVRISVADNGVGIPRRDQERVFEEFYRVRYADYGVQGAGLGLAIARRLARKLGGEITLQSREGEGSTFTLSLPRRSAA